jgi:hypothetical protein
MDTYTKKNLISRGLSGTRARLGLTKRCPRGYILRAPYRRKFNSQTKKQGYNVHRKNRTYRVYPTASSTIVKASCIKDRGLPGKGVPPGEEIGPLKKGELTRYGYFVRNSTEKRHRALRKAIDVYGALNVFQKINAVANLTFRLRGAAREAHRVLVADREWVKAHYVLKKDE